MDSLLSERLRPPHGGMADLEVAGLAELATGSLHRFVDWPNPDVPSWRAGVYTVWDDQGVLLYVGMAGRGLLADAHLSQPDGARKRRGLADRLNAHASGRRSGDQFCIYVFDRFVLPTLTPGQVRAAAVGDLSLDMLTRDYIRQHLRYRFVVTNDGQAALALERAARRDGVDGMVPVLNPL